jgi:hypothetical protein
MVRLALAASTLMLAAGTGAGGVVAQSVSSRSHGRPDAALASNSCRDLFGTSLEASGIPFGNSMSAKTSFFHSPSLVVKSICRPGRGGGWTISARKSGGASPAFTSTAFPFSSPVAILALYNYSSTALPAIVAQVGLGMTGQPYELMTFNGLRIVPAKMTFPSYGIYGLAGGGASAHGQGVECARQRSRLQLTQLVWSGPGPGAPMVPVKGGGESYAPGDKVSVEYVRWTFHGQPLTQVSVERLPSRVTTYAQASLLDNVHCSG